MLRLRWRRAYLSVAVIFNWLLPQSAQAGPQAAVNAYRINVAVHDGVPLSLYAEERGSGPTVVLLHGLGGSTYSWRYVAPRLARTHRVISIDFKGFGRSDKAFDTAYSAADQARLIETFLARRGVRDVTLIGHSFGGQVALLTALNLARRDPHRIRQLVLIDTPALPQPLSPLVALMQQPVLPYALVTAVPAEIMTRIALALSPPREPVARPYTEADASAYAAPFRDAAARHAYVQTSRQIVPQDFDRIVLGYRRLQQRTLLVWCTQDQVVPLATGRRLAGILPNASLVQVAGCNHAPTDEAPASLTHALIRFLDH
jgi:pimeloyl-ACP methyl ester carboxylesterase